MVSSNAEINTWPEAGLGIINSLLLGLAFINYIVYRKRAGLLFILLCTINVLATCLRVLPSKKDNFTQLAIADFVFDLVEPLFLILIGWLLSSWCNATATLIPKGLPTKIHRLFVILWVTLSIGTILCLVGHAQFYLLWDNVSTEKNGHSHASISSNGQMIATLLIPGLIIVLVWVVVLIGIIGVLYWYCNHAKNLCDPANLVKKQWQLCILLMSTVCCFVTLWFRIVVVASVLSHLQDKHKHIDVMPLIASMITLTEGQHTYLFWISYSARVSLAAGLAVPLIAFFYVARIDNPIASQFFCNNSNNTRTTSNNSNARNQIAVNRKKFKMNFMQNEVSTSDISDTRYLAKENRTEPLNTMLDIIVERNKDEETKSKEADVKDNQSETNAELSAVIIVQPNDTGRRTSNEDVVSDDDDDDDCYKLSSSFSQGLMEGRSRKTMMQLVKHSNANNSF